MQMVLRIVVGGFSAEKDGGRWWQVPYIFHFEPSLDALSVRSDVISPTKILSGRDC